MKTKVKATQQKQTHQKYQANSSAGFHTDDLQLPEDNRGRFLTLSKVVMDQVSQEHREQITATIVRDLQCLGYMEKSPVQTNPMLKLIESQLEQSGLKNKKDDPEEILDSVLATSFRRRHALLAESFTAPEVSKCLKISRQTPLNRAAKGELLAIYENGRYLFPKWQFDASTHGGVLLGLPLVLHALKVTPIEKLYWLQQPSPYLENRTPLETLKNGEFERVVSIARGVGE